jgi:AhpD family alkylhydroperoxidase
MAGLERYAAEHAEPRMYEHAEPRASLSNGCGYCIGMHSPSTRSGAARILSEFS